MVSGVTPSRLGFLNWKKGQFCFLLGVWLFSSVLSSLFLFSHRALYLDNHLMYGYFYNNLRSLNLFGEPAWWFPNHQYGLPGYLISHIGVINAGTPLFVLLGAWVWGLGALGVKLGGFLSLYLFFLCFALPLLFLLSVWSLARIFFQNGLVIAFILLTAAFSPAIFQNLKDPGFLEISAYGFLFLSAFLHYVMTGTGRAFAGLVLIFLTLAVSAGFILCVWDTWFLAVSLMVLLLMHSRFCALFKKRLQELGMGRISLVFLAGALCVLPKILIFLDFRGQIIRFGMEGADYSLQRMHAGNPWQWLLSSVPGIGFRNLAEEFTQFVPAAESFFPHPSYLGLLALPLILMGFLYGRRSLKTYFAAVIGVIYAIVLLGPSSPFVALGLASFPLSRSLNHYFDMVHGFGGAILLIFAIGLGLEAWLKHRELARRFLMLFALSSLLSIGIYTLNFSERRQLLGAFSGVFALLSLLFALVLWGLSETKSIRQRSWLWVSLIALALVDVSTHHWYFVKASLASLNRLSLDTPATNGLGTADPTINMGLDSAFYFRTSYELKNRGGDRLPEVALFSRYHVGEKPDGWDVEQALDGSSIQVSQDFIGSEAEKTFLANPGNTRNTRLQMKRLDFNSFEVEVENPSSSLLLVRDSFFPGWTAESNGKDVPIFRALGGLKLIALTSEMTRIHFRLFPKAIIYSFALAYFLIAVWLVRLLYSGWSFSTSRWNEREPLSREKPGRENPALGSPV